MKQAIVIILFLSGSLLCQSNMSEKELYYFFSAQDTTEMKLDLSKQGMEYRPMYVVLETDTLEITQISINENPYRNTNPKLVCVGIPSNTVYTNTGIYIYFKKFRSIGGSNNE